MFGKTNTKKQKVKINLKGTRDGQGWPMMAMDGQGWSGMGKDGQGWIRLTHGK